MFNWTDYTLLMFLAFVFDFAVCFITGFLTNSYRIRIVVLTLCIALTVVFSIVLTANGGMLRW